MHGLDVPSATNVQTKISLQPSPVTKWARFSVPQYKEITQLQLSSERNRQKYESDDYIVF